MKWLRAGLRLIVVTLLTLLGALILLIGWLLTAPFGRARARLQDSVFRLWSRLLLPVAGVRVSTAGEPPTPPFFLVSNHLSYLDVVVLGSRTGCVFVAKSEIAGWPVIGFLCRLVSTIFVDRTIRRDLPRVIDQIDRQLTLGRGVVLFGEGTSSMGATVLPFRPALLEPAVRSEMPVSVAALSYHTPEDEAPAHLAVCWWGGMTFPKHLLRFLTLRRTDAKLVFGQRRFHDADRKRLADSLRAAVLERFEPVVDEEG